MRNTEMNPLIQSINTLNQDQFTPFYFNLDDHHGIKVEAIFRIVPNKRLTALVQFQNEFYVAKCFFGKKHLATAKKNRLSYSLLERYHIQTPKLLQENSASSGKINILLYEYIAAPTLESVLLQENDPAHLLIYFTQTVHELATQHVYGLLQTDAHFNNYLIADDIQSDLPFQKKVICLDSSSFCLLKKPLNLKSGLFYLATFLSQLGTHYPKLQLHLFHHYLKARGASCTPKQEHGFFQALFKALQKRRLQFVKKLLRHSTAHQIFSEKQWRGVMMRSDGSTLAQVIAYFTSGCPLVFNILKAGRSATVMEAQIENRDIMMKRYHIKNRWHALRRWLRPSRAKHQWLILKQCEFARIPAPKVLGFMEKRRWGFQQDAIVFYEKVKGTPAPQFFESLKTQEEKHYFFKNISSYLKSIHDFQLIHGDLKLNNFVILENGQPILLDWDGAEFYSNVFLLKRAIQKDIQRFIENFTSEEDVKMAKAFFEFLF